MTRSAVKIDQMSITLQDRERRFALAVDGLTIAPGQAVALTGASGTGKTCLLELVGLLRRPDDGARYVLADGAGEQRDIGRIWRNGGASALSQLRGRSLGFVPQSGGLLGFLSLGQNIALSQKISGRIDADWVAELADRLALGDVLGLAPDALSIGQRQRGAIARALAHRPALVLADEPTAALDPDSAEAAMRLIVEAAQLGGSAVLISSHDRPLVARHTTRGYGLRLDTPAAGQAISRLIPDPEGAAP